MRFQMSFMRKIFMTESTLEFLRDTTFIAQVNIQIIFVFILSSTLIRT